MVAEVVGLGGVGLTGREQRARVGLGAQLDRGAQPSRHDDARVLALEIEGLLVTEHVVAPRLEHLAAHLSAELARELVEEELTPLVGEPRRAERVHPVVLGVGHDDELLDQPHHARQPLPRRHALDGEELHAGSRLLERVDVADEVHLDDDAQLAARAAERVVQREPACQLYVLVLVQQRVEVNADGADLVVRGHVILVDAFQHEWAVLQVAVVRHLDTELLVPRWVERALLDPRSQVRRVGEADLHVSVGAVGRAVHDGQVTCADDPQLDSRRHTHARARGPRRGGDATGGIDNR